MIEKIDSFLVTGARDVFATMLDWTVETPLQPEGDGLPHPFELKAINGNIGFGGRMTGSLFLSAPQPLAEQICRQILGDSAGPQEISDVIGELTNMLAGGCKSRLCDAGCTVVMSIPSVIQGSKLWANSRDVSFMVKRTFTLPAQQHDFQVILVGKLN